MHKNILAVFPINYKWHYLYDYNMIKSISMKTHIHDRVLSLQNLEGDIYNIYLDIYGSYVQVQHSRTVQTIEQYKFIYFAIADFVETQKTTDF